MRRSDQTWPWMPASDQPWQPDDAEGPAERTNNELFTPPRMYRVETICAPCGVVIAWAKFPKAESPANILNFLDHACPIEEARPAYICIDKACLVLRTSVANGTWQRWQNKVHCGLLSLCESSSI